MRASSLARRSPGELVLLAARRRSRGAEPFTAIVSRSHVRPETLAFLDQLGNPDRTVLGSSLKLGVLARGEADVYPRFGPTSEWDTAAGQAILEATGGCVVTADGEPLLYGKKDGLPQPVLHRLAEAAREPILEFVRF